VLGVGKKELSLTEHTEVTEVRASLELFMNEMVINLFSVLPEGLSEAGKRNAFKFLPWVILHFSLFILQFSICNKVLL
jgi:hypothetical protein